MNLKSSLVLFAPLITDFMQVTSPGVQFIFYQMRTGILHNPISLSVSWVERLHCAQGSHGMSILQVLLDLI